MRERFRSIRCTQPIYFRHSTAGESTGCQSGDKPPRKAVFGWFHQAFSFSLFARRVRSRFRYAGSCRHYGKHRYSPAECECKFSYDGSGHDADTKLPAWSRQLWRRHAGSVNIAMMSTANLTPPARSLTPPEATAIFDYRWPAFTPVPHDSITGERRGRFITDDRRFCAFLCQLSPTFAEIRDFERCH